MKNKLALLTTAVVFFLLGSTITPFVTAYAQDSKAAPTKPLYFNIDFCKTRPGADMLKWQGKWKPFHQEMVNAGRSKYWAVLQPQFMGHHDYDFITIQTFEDYNAYYDSKFAMGVFKKLYGDQMNDIFKQSEESRDILSSELWEVSMSAQ